ncbi:MAG: HAD family hydrolase [Treponema sp.]|jgi:putative hydrolase of the HAD superfamily|nr:HAD family hydrolase [Treponema sp.]
MYDAALRARFIQLIQNASPPMTPRPPPALPPDLEALAHPPEPDKAARDIRAVLFDVYGTLFTSAAGDIGVFETAPAPEGGFANPERRAFFRAQVERLHREASAKTAYPEIRVEEVWKPYLDRLAGQGQALPMTPWEFALRYELATNPVYPMPGAKAILQALGRAGYALGIISNAQFFTPLLFEALMGESAQAIGFDPTLCVYSYEALEAKPSPGLFDRARKGLAALGIAPQETLYVGNDMLKDIAPARSMGFTTALFAGDGRSLRLREGNAQTQGMRPRRVIRRLEDLAGCFALP